MRKLRLSSLNNLNVTELASERISTQRVWLLNLPMLDCNTGCVRRSRILLRLPERGRFWYMSSSFCPAKQREMSIRQTGSLSYPTRNRKRKCVCSLLCNPWQVCTWGHRSDGCLADSSWVLMAFSVCTMEITLIPNGS